MFPLFAEESTYGGLENREIKALSEEQVAGYLGGKGMGMALPGELNGYPGPMHVLELADSLELSSSQRAAVERAFEAMQSQAIALGKSIVAAETRLDAEFATGTIGPDQLQTTSEEIGLLQGQLRAVHLLAHLETKALLTDAQVEKYGELRGYNESEPSAAKHHGHGH
ncbi:MAG: hypothetical protein K8J08_20650 [Thermoanaerobaculia bacterium]|nr:hypothetical protein [Thermoanaerobaculia bacterium]